MALVTHQMQGSYSMFLSRPLSWDKGIKLKQKVATFHVVGRADRHFLLKNNICLSVGAPRNSGKLKHLRISAFKGSAQNGESAGRAGGSKVPKNSVQLKESEGTVTESPKANDIPLSYTSEANESIVSSPAIRKLFTKWLTMLRTPPPSQVVDEVLGEEPSLRERSETQHGTQIKERGEILPAAWCYFLGLDISIKIPLLIFIPLYLAVNVIYGAEVSKELTPLWVFGPLIIALYIKMVRWLCALYAFSFKLTVEVIKNLPTYCRLAYNYVACGKLKEEIRARLWQPIANIKNLDYKELSRRKLKELQEQIMESRCNLRIHQKHVLCFGLDSLGQVVGATVQTVQEFDSTWIYHGSLKEILYLHSRLCTTTLKDMAVKIGSSFSCLVASVSSPFQSRRCPQLTLSRGFYEIQRHGFQQLKYSKVKSCQCMAGKLKSSGRFLQRQNSLCAISEEQTQNGDLEPKVSELEINYPNAEDVSPANSLPVHFVGTGGKPGSISFYSTPYKKEDEYLMSKPQKSQNNLLWLIGPSVLVASFIFPSLYLRRILSNVFEDSLLTGVFDGPKVTEKLLMFETENLKDDSTDMEYFRHTGNFLILFFTEALFYCGVAVFVFLMDHLTRPIEPDSTTVTHGSLAPHLGQRISSVVSLVLSLIVPLVTMGLVWPWTGPAASATLAPFLVGIIVQFAFEQYARYTKSRSWSVIPVIFQVYRLHQLNRAAQLVTALSFTVRGAEMTAQNLAISSSLRILLNVLQFLGVICIWSLSSFLMRCFPSTAMTVQ
ncbi:hypothetical protein CJ030_MR0G005894 [Morella rubra]|uniref:Uncharacterized protein n=1 Tax=Morella rubra TaxID=262757 RepID=A0A6A1UMB7_9ROSI|nr:hypothetical protein CJ030_MR0G005894 [Morella rubra]